MEQNPHRVPVKVIASFDLEGNITPTWLATSNGPGMDIDRVIDVRPAAALKAGGAGMRYTIEVSGQTWFLFFSRNCWFIEK